MRLKAFLSGLLALLVSVSPVFAQADEGDVGESSNPKIRQLMENIQSVPASEFHAELMRKMEAAHAANDVRELEDLAIFVNAVSKTVAGHDFLHGLKGREYSQLINRTMSVLLNSQEGEIADAAGDFVGNLMQAWVHTPDRSSADEYRKYLALMRPISLLYDANSIVELNEVMITKAGVNPIRSVETFNREGVAKLVAANLLSDITQNEWQVATDLARKHGFELPSIDSSKLKASGAQDNSAIDAIQAAREALAQAVPEPEANDNSQSHGHGHGQPPAKATPEMIEAEKTKLLAILQSKSVEATLFEIRTAIRGRTSSHKRAELDAFIAAATEVFESDAGQRFLSRLSFEQHQDLIEKSMFATQKSKLEDREQIKKRLLKTYMSAFTTARIPLGLNHYRKYLSIMKWALRDSPSDAETLKTSDNLLGNEGSPGQSTAAFMTKGFAAIEGGAANLKLSYVERDTLRKIAKLSRVTVPASVTKKMPPSRVSEIVQAVLKLGRYVKEKARSVRARLTRPAINSCEGSFAP